MHIEFVLADKKRFLDLLLLGDEQESMIDRYLEDGALYALYDGNPKIVRAVCVVSDNRNGDFEIKNIAVAPDSQRKGYGRAMVEWVCNRYAPLGRRMLVGTGDSPLTLPFYEACGFRVCGRIPNFFVDNYDHPIVEGDRILRDMILLECLL